MSSGGKGGSQSSSVEIPGYLEDALKSNLSRAEEFSRLGYMPYYGPTVAAMTPSQLSAMQNTNSMANAFGMSTPSSPNAGLPQAQNYGGMTAYSSGDIYDQAISELRNRRPGALAAFEGMFIDPVTGGSSKYDQALLSDALIRSGVDPTLAEAAASGSEYNGVDFGAMNSTSYGAPNLVDYANAVTNRYGLNSPQSRALGLALGPTGAFIGGALAGSDYSGADFGLGFDADFEAAMREDALNRAGLLGMSGGGYSDGGYSGGGMADVGGTGMGFSESPSDNTGRTDGGYGW